MEYRLLGPVEALDGGAPLRLGGRQRRTVLALLLVRAGEVVTTDRLVAELWGDDPPVTARKTVQAHIAHLRKALDGDEGMLVATGDGYIARPQSLDIREFDRLVAAAWRDRRSDPTAAAEAYDAALSLFRGAPLSGVADDAQSLRVEAARLEQARLNAVEDRLELALEGGDLALVASEAERLVAEHPLRERLWGLLMLALYRSGRQSEALRAYSRLRQVLATELGIEPSAELRDLERRVLDQDPTLESGAAPSPQEPETGAEPIRNPYKGLRPFDEPDAADFFGREELVRRLVDTVTARNGPGTIVVAGPSGAGKSSVVRAGLVPELRRMDRKLGVMFPGANPFLSLGEAVAAAADAPVPRPDGDVTAWSGLLEGLVIVVDQAEELFTLDEAQTDAGSFLNLVAGTSGPTTWIFTLRADFLDPILRHPLLGPQLEEGLVLVPPLLEHEVAAAVLNPARRVGIGVEPGLIAEITRDVAARPAALPLLQYAITDTFERRRAEELTLTDYRAGGGIAGALTRRADDLFDGLDADHQEATRQLLLRLVTVTDEGARVRRRVERAALGPRSGDTAVVDRIIERLGAQRLLVFDHDPRSGRSTVEVAHEALLHEWPRLSNWIDEARHDLPVQRRLAAALAEWEASGREPSFLLRGARLAEMQAWAEGTRLDLAPDEAAFLDEGHWAEDVERRQRRNRRRAMAGVLILAAVFIGIAAVLAVLQRDQARQAARLATARELAAASTANLGKDPELSTLLALEAIAAGEGTLAPEAEEALHRAVLATRQIGSIRHSGQGIAHFAPDGGSFVTSGEDPSVARVWTVDPLEVAVELKGHRDEVIDAVFDRSGTRIATTSFDASLRVWNAATGATEAVLIGGGPPLIPVFDWQGERVAATTFSPEVDVWDLASGELEWSLQLPPGANSALNLEFSPDGGWLAIAADADRIEPAAYVWDLSTGQLEAVLTGHDGLVRDVGFSPDGSRLFTASLDTTVRVWDTATWETVATYTGHRTPVWDLAVSEDGTRVASSGSNEALVWETASTETVASFVGHTGKVDGIDLAGDRVLTASFDDGTARLWDLGPHPSRELITVDGPANRPGAVAFSPDGGVLIASRADRVTMLRVPDGVELATLDGPGEETRSISYSPDGREIALAGSEGVELVDVAGNELETIERGDSFSSVAYLPSGRLVVGGGDVFVGDPLTPLPLDGRFSYAVAAHPRDEIIAMSLERFLEGVVEVRRSDGRLLASLTDHEGPVASLAFSPDGSLLATASEDTRVIVYDAADFSIRHRLTGHSAQVLSLAFHPTLPELATAGDDGSIRIWDLATGTTRISIPAAPISDLAYSPDGRYLAAVSPAGEVLVYMLDVDELVAEARGRLTRGLTEAECLQYLHLDACP